MKKHFASLLISGLSISFSCLAAAPPTAPAGSTGLCKDGTYYSGAEKSGACKGHKGVKEWYVDAASGKGEMTKADTKAPAPKEAVAPTAAPAPASAAAASATATQGKPAAAPAAGGGDGKVWVNSASKTYHCPGTKYYGKTKAGEYMSEADAKAKGNHPDHKKACS
jgi:hypothetical protein